MKAILMIDNPKTCSECRIVHPDLGGYYCPFEPIHIPDKIATTEKMGWCPLKNLPEKKPETLFEKDPFPHVVGSFDAFGWNRCLDEIIGETDEHSTQTRDTQ